MNREKALFIGAACVDVVIYLERLPHTEEDMHPYRQTFALGGCTANAARAALLLSDAIELASPVGTGVYGELVRKFLSEAQIPVRIQVNEDNGCCYCFVEDGGERTFLSVHGAEYTFKREWMRAFDNEIFRYVYVSGLEIEESTGNDLIDYLAEYPERTIVYCPGTRGIGIAEKNMKLFALHPILHLNGKEATALAESLGGESSATGMNSGLAAERFLRSGSNVNLAAEAARTSVPSEVLSSAAQLHAMTQNTVVVTLGEKGAYCLPGRGDGFFVPAKKTEVVNTIGAGDTHAGAFIASLLNGKDLRKSLETANDLAALTVSIEAPVPDSRFV